MVGTNTKWLAFTMNKLRLILLCLLPLVLAGCGYGHATLRIGGCPGYYGPSLIVDFHDSRTGRPLAVDASGVLSHNGSSKILEVYEAARPDPLIYSLFADTNHGGIFTVELFVARTVNSPLQTIIYEDVRLYFDECGPITKYIHVNLD